MRVAPYHVAIVFPADPLQLSATRVENSRLKEVAHALASAGAEVVSAPFCDEIASEMEALLAEVDFVLVWYNPFESGRDRSRLNAMLRALASRGVGVSAHPAVIDKMGTKDVLFQTRHLAWGTDARRFDPIDVTGWWMKSDFYQSDESRAGKNRGTSPAPHQIRSGTLSKSRIFLH
jgi:hypothetical protein